MGMNLGQTRETIGAVGDQSWLGSAHGTDIAESVTLDGARFTTDTQEGRWPEGEVPSGVVVARDATSGLVVPYDETYDSDPNTTGAQPNGAENAIGHLLEGVRIDATDPQNPSAALYWHGEVIVANLPTGHGLNASAAAELNQIRYVGTVPA